MPEYFDSLETRDPADREYSDGGVAATSQARPDPRCRLCKDIGRRGPERHP